MQRKTTSAFLALAIMAGACIAPPVALAKDSPERGPHTGHSQQYRRAAEELQRGLAERKRLEERDRHLLARLYDATARLDAAMADHRNASYATAAALAEERRLAAMADAARQRSHEAHAQVAHQQSHLDHLRRQQNAIFATSWTSLEYRTAGPQVSIFLRNSSPIASIRVMYQRRIAIPPGMSQRPHVPPNEVAILAPGQALNIGTYHASDRVLHEATIISAEWERGTPPVGIRIISAAEIISAELALADLQRAASHAASAEHAAAGAHAHAAGILHAARRVEGDHERRMASERREVERINRDRMLLAAQMREVDRKLAIARANYQKHSAAAPPIYPTWGRSDWSRRR